MKAVLKDYRQSPRKVRLIADLVRGKRVGEALTMLKFTDKKASAVFEKLINSATANAAAKGRKDTNTLVITKANVDQGTMFKRFMPRARGTAAAIHKRNSHITIELGEK